jgi:hypothetical protein
MTKATGDVSINTGAPLVCCRRATDRGMMWDGMAGLVSGLRVSSKVVVDLCWFAIIHYISVPYYHPKKTAKSIRKIDK